MVKIDKAICGNTDLLTAQAFVFRNFLCICICAEGEDAFTKVRQVAPQSDEIFFGSDDAISSRMEKLFVKLTEQLSDLKSLGILAAYVKGDIVYIRKTEGVRAFLRKKGAIVDLTARVGENKLLSGYVEQGDKMLLVGVARQQGLEGLIEGLFEAGGQDLEDEIEMCLQKDSFLGPMAVIQIESIEDEVGQLSPKEQNTRTKIDYKRMGRELLGYLQPVFLTALNKIAVTFGQIFTRFKKQAVVAGLIVLVVGLVFFGYNFFTKRGEQKFLNENKSLIQEARDHYAKAQEQKSTGPEQSVRELDNATLKLDALLKSDPKNDDAKDLKAEIEQNRGSILKIYQVQDWPVFLSLDLIRKDFSSKRLSFSLGRVLLLDQHQKTLVTIDLSSKTNQILAGERQLGQAEIAALNGSRVFVYSKNKGLIKMEVDDKKIETVSSLDEEWGAIVDVFGFGGNLYALDSLKSQIWKYIPTTSGYSNKFAYLKSVQGGDLSGAKRLQIDYSVWVLESGTQINKFTAGGSDHFSVGGMDKPLKELKSFFVPEEDERIFLLDSENSRVVVVNKSGQYVSQYVGDKFITADDLVVDIGGNKIYLLEGNKIYVLDLK